jgi:hypothetical protein
MTSPYLFQNGHVTDRFFLKKIGYVVNVHGIKCVTVFVGRYKTRAVSNYNVIGSIFGEYLNMSSQHSRVLKKVIIEKKFYGQVTTIDCTEMTRVIGAIHPTFDWELMLNGTIPLECSAIVKDINSNYGKVSLKTLDFPEDVAVMFRSYLAKPKEDRIYTLPVWMDKLGELEIKLNLKRVLLLLQENPGSSILNQTSEERLLNAIRHEDEVKIKMYMKPYQMELDSGVKMGIYFDVLEFIC